MQHIQQNRKRFHVVIAGAGVAGLAAGVGLARAGFTVDVLERDRQPCQRQSGPLGGQARLHAGYLYLGNPAVARAINAERSLQREAPEAIVEVPAIYYINRAVRPAFLAGCREAGLPVRERRVERTAVARELRDEVFVVESSDKVIDPLVLRERLLSDLHGSGGQVHCDVEVVGARRYRDELTAIIGRTSAGVRRWPCHFFVNVAGAGLLDVARATSGADLDALLERTATAVMRCAGFLPGKPAIHQCYGWRNSLAVIPIGRGRRVSVATGGGYPVSRADEELPPLELEEQRLRALVDDTFAGVEWTDRLATTWCVKAQLSHPGTRAAAGDAVNRLVTVVPGGQVGGAVNEVHATPGKLGSAIHCGEAITAEVLRHFGRRQAA